MKNLHIHAAMSLLLVALLSVALILCACPAEPPAGGTQTTASTAANAPGGTTATTTTGSSSQSGRLTYTVTVVDEAGNPIEGVEVQICDGDRCLLPNITDANGTVSWKTTSGNFEAQIKDAPAGYTYDAELHIPFPAGETALTVTLTAA